MRTVTSSMGESYIASRDLLRRRSFLFGLRLVERLDNEE